MNRTDFLIELDKKLRLHKMPPEEIALAITYYSEYFDDAGPENEQKVLSDLGSPSEVATQILSNYAMKEMSENPQSVKKGVSAIWYVILAIFAAPIALPIAIAALAVIFSVAIGLFSAIISVFIALLAVAVAGFVLTTIGVILLFVDLPLALLIVGTGLALMGISLITFPAFKWIAVKCAHGVANLFNKILKRGRKNERVY
ncbi:MAG: DUF1700 domain-containing protein [Coriobacteriia bacterium]|nr:DUF1700 domain-containing protein [Coriobacteriia bacterium]